MIEQYLFTHPGTLLIVAGWVGTAFTSTIPPQCPRSLDDWWTWGREFVHQVSNQKRNPSKTNPDLIP